MRPSSLFAALAIATYASPIPQLAEPLLGALRDTILDTVGSLLGYPFELAKDTAFLPCTFNSRLCIGTCAANCIGGAQACSDCMTTCYNKNTCHDRKKGDKDEPNGKEGRRKKNQPGSDDEQTPPPESP
ncbi:hypothetical protein F4861DRAFT_536312 [Xylaria intraflava]|nr:hypothetical protein F4861DRAFT_536312 [Xylaria intraflava]